MQKDMADKRKLGIVLYGQSICCIMQVIGIMFTKRKLIIRIHE